MDASELVFCFISEFDEDDPLAGLLSDEEDEPKPKKVSAKKGKASKPSRDLTEQDIVKEPPVARTGLYCFIASLAHSQRQRTNCLHFSS